MELLEQLTPRQFEILSLVSKGLSNKEISGLLNISNNTVKVHVAAITNALGTTNRTESAALFHELEGAKPTGVVEAEFKVNRRLGRPAIAVAGFDQVGAADERLAHLAEGLTEDLITRLSSWRWFPVMIVDRSQLNAAEATTYAERQSNLRYVVSGTLRCEADQVRLNVHLWETPTKTTIWSDVVAFDISATLDAQDRVAKQVMATLAPELLAFESRTASEAATPDFEAWRHTMSGMWHLQQRSPTEVSLARAKFERAIALDDRFALPWFGMMWVHHHALIEQWSQDDKAEMVGLERAVVNCERLDPNGAQTQIALGMLDVLRGRRGPAIKHLERAAYFNPSSTQALGLLGQCYCLSDDPDRAIAAVEEALQLNPYNPNTWAQRAVIGLAHYAAGRLTEAIEFARQAIVDKPNAITAHLVLVAALVELDRLTDARQTHEQLKSLRPNFELNRYLELIAPVADPAQVERLLQAFAQVGVEG